MKPFVSVITPTYNHQDYISTCIESVISQTYTNWELIIIDDCSNDKTYKIAVNYAMKDKRIKIIKHKYRWGLKKLTQTYNQALKLSKGNLIAILEGDDYWPKNKLKIQVRSFNDEKVILSFGDSFLVSKNGSPLDIKTYRQNKKMLSNPPTGSIIYLFYDLNFFISPVTVVIRKNALKQIKGFKNNVYYPFVDIPTFLELSLIGRFSYINDLVGYYRKHENSSWFNYVKKTNAMGRTEIAKCLNAFINKNQSFLKGKNINIYNDQILKKLNTNLEKKRKQKDISIIKHYLAFENYREIEFFKKKELTGYSHSVSLLLFFLTTSIKFVNYKFILSFIGNLRILFYRLKRFIS